jgi:hypothetical protein
MDRRIRIHALSVIRCVKEKSLAVSAAAMAAATTHG